MEKQQQEFKCRGLPVTYDDRLGMPAEITEFRIAISVCVSPAVWSRAGWSAD